MSDERIVEYLRARGRVEPPLDLVAGIARQVAELPQRRSSPFAPWMPALAAVGAAVVIAGVTILLVQAPNVGPSPVASDSPAPSASSPAPSVSATLSADLTQPGNVVEMPALDDEGRWGTIRLERGEEYAVEPELSLHPGGSVMIAVHVTYEVARGNQQGLGASEWSLRSDGAPVELRGAPVGALPDPRQDHVPLEERNAVRDGAVVEGWIGLEIPTLAAGAPMSIGYHPGGDLEAVPAWEILVRAGEADGEAEPGDLLDLGNSNVLPIESAEGVSGIITLERGEDVGGYPLMASPSSELHFFVEVMATYELGVAPETASWGQVDWRVEGASGPVGAEPLQTLPQPAGRPYLGTWPGATVPESTYQGWIIFAVPRDAADSALELVYQPPGVGDATRIPLRRPGAAPEPVVVEWPRPDPVYVAQSGLPFTVLESAEADALFVDADTCTNPDDGYTVSYPDSWYTNTEIGDVPACSWFSPTFYEAPEGGPPPNEIAIGIRVFEDLIGVIWVDLYSEDVTIGGFSGRRYETGMTKDPRQPTNVLQYVYLAYLDPEPPEGRKIWASTGTDSGGEYELNRAILDRIMASLEFTD